MNKSVVLIGAVAGSAGVLAACAGEGPKPHYCDQGILSTAANQVFNPELFAATLAVRAAMEPWCIDSADWAQAHQAGENTRRVAQPARQDSRRQ